MRMIGAIEDEAAARRFGDFLLTLNIENSVDPASSGWAVWVLDDDQLDQAKVELEKFFANPDSDQYKASRKTAKAKRKEEARDTERKRKLFVDVRTQSSLADRMGGARPLCFALLAASLVVGGLTRLGDKQEGVMDLLVISSWPDFEELAKNVDPQKLAEYWQRAAAEGELDSDFSERRMNSMMRELYGWTGFEDVQKGELWRLVTPIFLHFGWLHILFNMLWVYDLGGIVERKKGTLFLLIMVLTIAIISNVAQCWMSGPLFGGMSGVLYGLFGYVWMKGRYQPQERIGLAKNTVMILMIWLVFCMTGAIGPIGNTAHVVGLVVGMGFGAGPFFIKKWWRERAAS